MLTFAIRLSFLEALVGYAEAGIQTDQISVPNAPLLGFLPISSRSINIHGSTDVL